MGKNFDDFTSSLDRETELCDIHTIINKQVRKLEGDKQIKGVHYAEIIKNNIFTNDFINLYKIMLNSDFSLNVLQNNPKYKKNFLKVSELNRRQKHLIIISHGAVFDLKESLINVHKAILKQEKKFLENWFVLSSQEWKAEKIKYMLSEQELLVNKFIESHNSSFYILRDEIFINTGCDLIETFLKKIIGEEEDMIEFSKRIIEHKKLESKLIDSINATNMSIKVIMNIISYKKSKEDG